MMNKINNHKRKQKTKSTTTSPTPTPTTSTILLLQLLLLLLPTIAVAAIFYHMHDYCIRDVIYLRLATKCGGIRDGRRL